MQMMMRRLGSMGSGPNLSLQFVGGGGQANEMMDPLAMQLSLMDRDFTDAGAASCLHALPLLF